MRKVLCTNSKCKGIGRTKEAFTPGKCPVCNKGQKVIHIKGNSELVHTMPEGHLVNLSGHSTIPRYYRPVMKSGAPKNRFNP